MKYLVWYSFQIKFFYNALNESSSSWLYDAAKILKTLLYAVVLLLRRLLKFEN